MKFAFAVLAGTLLVIIGAAILFSRGESEESLGTPPPLSSSYEYFWGDGCQACAQVQEFFDGWEDKDKVEIDKKEVWYNRGNEKLFKQRGASCDINQKNLGVPMLFTPDGECIIGVNKIKEELISKALES